MKKILSVFVVLLVGCTGSPDLAPDGKQIPFDVTTINVQLEKPAGKCFIDIKKALVNRGYSIQSTDKDTLSTQTNFRKLNKTTTSLLNTDHTETSISVSTFEVSKKMCRARLTGKIKMPSVGESHIRLGGLDDSPIRMGWNELHGFAKSLNPTKIEYEK